MEQVSYAVIVYDVIRTSVIEKVVGTFSSWQEANKYAEERWPTRKTSYYRIEEG